MKKILLTILLCVFVYGCGPQITLNEKRQIAFAAHPEWSDKVKNKICNDIISTGMTKEQIDLAWGGGLNFLSGDSYGYTRYEGSFGDRDENGMFHFYDYYFTFYKGKLESWSRHRQYSY